MTEMFAVRHRYTQDVLAYFKARPLIWIDAHELATVGGFCAWRTRVSDARKVIAAEGGTVEWNGQTRGSAYRYRPYVSQGRDASEPITQPTLW